MVIAGISGAVLLVLEFLVLGPQREATELQNIAKWGDTEPQITLYEGKNGFMFREYPEYGVTVRDMCFPFETGPAKTRRVVCDWKRVTHVNGSGQ